MLDGGDYSGGGGGTVVQWKRKGDIWFLVGEGLADGRRRLKRWWETEAAAVAELKQWRW